MQELEEGAEQAPVAETPSTSVDSQTAGLLAAAAALALSSCGGGEEGGSPSRGSRDPPVPPTPIPPPPAPGPLPPAPQDSVPATDAEAVRFVLQAQFSVSDADISSLKSGGLLAWLDARYNEPLGETGVAWLDSRGHGTIDSEKRYRQREPGDYMIWNQLLAGPDQMRKRMALALSELFVVSLTGLNFQHPSYLIAGYWDVLTANAFGNYRQLLDALTLNAAMGFFLSTRGNAQGKLQWPAAR